MANQRLFLFIALSFVALMLFQAWEKDYGTKAPVSTPTAAAPQAPTSDKPAPVPGQAAATATPAAADVPTAQPTAPGSDAMTVDGSANRMPTGKRIHVRTDVFDAVIDTVGGDLRQVDLEKYTVSVSDHTPYRIMTDTGAHLYVAQSGFSMLKGDGPDHNTLYQAERTDYTLAPGEKTLKVNLHWSAGGVAVTKTYVFHRDSYVIDVDYTVKNASGAPWQGSFYRHLQRTHYAEKTGNRMFIHTYMGGAIYTPADHYKKISFSDIQEKPLSLSDIQGGWAAMLQHYFVGAWIPDADTKNTFYSLYRSNPYHSYYLGMKSPIVTIPAGGDQEFRSRLYIGPKLQDTLAAVSPGLELTVDYGILTVLAKPIFWLLKTLHKLVGNWGWSIILLTMLIKLAFYKLSETSYRSMAKMRNVQPRMKALKERFGDDKQKLNQAMMELYKTEKINPLGGCLPIVVQIPVFIALYWVLLESVELRQAPFIFWIKDLSVADPYYVLPILMGITMFLQQRLNPSPLDPIQQKIMMVLPLMFTVFFLFFPAGLVVYWVVNNSLSILQQWVITRRIAKGAKS